MKSYFVLFTSLVILSLLSSCDKDNKIKGCMDSASVNFNPDAQEDDGSCEKYKSTSSDKSTSSASETTMLLGEDVMVYNFITSSSENGLAEKRSGKDSLAVPSCATISFDNGGSPTSWPKTLTIDFGNLGCMGYDNKSRKGKIIAKFSSLWRLHNAGDSIMVTFDNYTVNDTVFTGTRYFWLQGSTASELVVGYKVADASIVFSSSSKISWAGNGTFSVTGLITPSDYTDDVISLSITGTATNIEGNSYTIKTVDNLTANLNCMDNCLFVKGVLEVATTSKTTVTYGSIINSVTTVTTISVNFGNGTCDGILSYSTNVFSKSGNGTILLNETIPAISQTCDSF